MCNSPPDYWNITDEITPAVSESPSERASACTTGMPPLLCSSDDGDNMVIRQMAFLQQKVLTGDNGNARVAIGRQQMEMEEKEIIKLCITTELA